MPLAVLTVVLSLSACSGAADGAGAGTAAGVRAPSTTPTSPAGISRSPGTSAQAEGPAAGEASASPSAGPTFLQLPAGPATPAPPPAPAAPGTLAARDWTASPHPPGCTGPAGDPVPGDLDGDGTAELALPVACGDRTAVHVYAGDAAAPRLLGDALPAEEAAEHYRTEVRDGYLVVTAVRHGGGDGHGEQDTAVTTRWVVRGGQLVRSDRWEDPASTLEVDAH